jgi:hypothetical protein
MRNKKSISLLLIDTKESLLISDLKSKDKRPEVHYLRVFMSFLLSKLLSVSNIDNYLAYD